MRQLQQVRGQTATASNHHTIKKQIDLFILNGSFTVFNRILQRQVCKQLFTPSLLLCPFHVLCGVNLNIFAFWRPLLSFTLCVLVQYFHLTHKQSVRTFSAIFNWKAARVFAEMTEGSFSSEWLNMTDVSNHVLLKITENYINTHSEWQQNNSISKVSKNVVWFDRKVTLSLRNVSCVFCEIVFLTKHFKYQFWKNTRTETCRRWPVWELDM